jgi:hypothetical protein
VLQLILDYINVVCYGLYKRIGLGENIDVRVLLGHLMERLEQLCITSRLTVVEEILMLCLTFTLKLLSSTVSESKDRSYKTFP